MQQFEFACGTVQGKDHRRLGKNNQDTCTIYTSPKLSVAIVCDGCGSSESPYSEAGSLIGSRMMEQNIIHLSQRALNEPRLPQPDTEDFWEIVRLDTVAQLRVLARQMGESLSDIVGKYFLFTTLCAVITEDIAVFTAIGDGTFYINGNFIDMGDYEGNEPPYLGYGIVKSTLPSGLEKFRMLMALPKVALDTFLIGSDGALQLSQAANKPLPGKNEPVGDISQFWTNDLFFQNQFALGQRLSLINRQITEPNWQEQRLIQHHGLLNDDTTVVTGRRKLLSTGEVDDLISLYRRQTSPA